MPETPEEYAQKFPELTWFGEHWGGEVNRLFPQMPTPAGQRCSDCRGVIRSRDRGVQMPTSSGRVLRYHLVCWATGVLGLSPE